MDALATALVPIHIGAGSLVFLLGPLALLLPKGSNLHRYNGRLFFAAVCVLFTTDMIIGYVRNSALLLSVGLLVFYFALSGYRALWFKNKADLFGGWKRPGALDKGSAQFLVVAGVGIVMAALTPGSDYPLPYFILSLGIVAVVLGVYDLKRFRSIRDGGKDGSPEWLYQHMTRMVGAVLVALAGFIGFRLTYEPVWARWLPVFVIGFGGIALWASILSCKIASGASPDDLFDVRIAQDDDDDEDLEL